MKRMADRTKWQISVPSNQQAVSGYINYHFRAISIQQSGQKKKKHSTSPKNSKDTMTNEQAPSSEQNGFDE